MMVPGVFRAARNPFSPAMIIALLALAVATGGTAYAAVVITGVNVKDGTLRSADIADGIYGVRSRDVRNGSLGAIDLSAAARVGLKGNVGDAGPRGAAGAIGPQGGVGEIGPTGATGSTGATGAAGTAGAQGNQGAAGQRGLSAWDTIPSGTTVTGGYDYDSQTGDTVGDYAFYVDLGARAPVALESADVNFAPLSAADDESPNCTGSVTAPTAPIGEVCIYVADSAGSSLEGTTSLNASPTTGFIISMYDDDATPADLFVVGTWAYTAP